LDYVFDFGSVTFGSTTDPTFKSTFSFPEGTIITAFAKSCQGTSCSFTATPNSEALLIDTPIRVPEPASAAILLSGLFGIGLFRRSRRS